jgi:hypothetical protein
MCVTTDNASSKVSFIENLATDTVEFERPFLQGNWIRCLAHVINVAVQASLTRLTARLETVRGTFTLLKRKNVISYFSLASVFSECHKQFFSTPTEVQVCHVNRRGISSCWNGRQCSDTDSGQLYQVLKFV